jgi:hypothetical protein
MIRLSTPVDFRLDAQRAVPFLSLDACEEKDMKRFLMLSSVAGVLIGIPVSHQLWSAPPAGRKTTLCHVDQDEGTAHVIRVGNPAVPAHLRHGDCVLEEGQECSFDDVNGIAVCAVPEPME